ncbi:GNAT family N-acetyltransferase [Allorhizobium taibaishanense]|uniref:GNAT family N-acetyltransferase n=1 Tax=Allorhizobium taibaishanense TaxID=887144 RepID=A0A1Q9A9B1_9HYPH|nr:GNAT family N-acetyltransferase [Allorhizobium taibaishanense]MBB4009774.1 GNAT superfamily N-acetyltransferase [Allorhizobium taibaishanense]OLP51427.1 GNAT family N-acetyltransferase [Allorhizobium taibaishanense]
MKIDILVDDTIFEGEVVEIYKANNWSSAHKPKELLAALQNSHTLITARSNNRLLGLANSISDGHLVVYFPHLLVHPDYHRLGIGRQLMMAMLKKYADFHQIMLTADGNSTQFYETLGFSKAGSTVPMWIYAGKDH